MISKATRLAMAHAHGVAAVYITDAGLHFLLTVSGLRELARRTNNPEEALRHLAAMVVEFYALDSDAMEEVEWGACLSAYSKCCQVEGTALERLRDDQVVGVAVACAALARKGDQVARYAHGLASYVASFYDGEDVERTLEAVDYHFGPSGFTIEEWQEVRLDALEWLMPEEAAQ